MKRVSIVREGWEAYLLSVGFQQVDEGGRVSGDRRQQAGSREEVGRVWSHAESVKRGSVRVKRG